MEIVERRAAGSGLPVPLGVPALVLAFLACIPSGASAATWYISPVNGHKYALTSAALSWTDAQAEAASLGAHLVTVTTREEEIWVENQFSTGELGGLTIGNYWIGLTDIGHDPGDWFWVSGEPLLYTHWRPGNPDNIGVEHYVQWFGSFWDNRTNTNQTSPFTGGPRLVYGVMELTPPTQIKTPFAIPEPSGIVLAGIGLICGAPLIGVRWRAPA